MRSEGRVSGVAPGPALGVFMSSSFESVSVGPWKFDPALFVITHAAEPGYQVRVKSMETSAQVLDWIFQVRGKHWVKPVDMETFLRLLMMILNPQGTLCSWGVEQGPIDVKATVYRVLGGPAPRGNP
jgi:hypothetical protein